jgi:hypothetical protein
MSLSRERSQRYSLDKHVYIAAAALSQPLRLTWPLGSHE